MAGTKILLLEDVDAVGRKGDIASVKAGYAYNFLIPKGFALIADIQALKKQARLQEERQKKAILDKKESEEIAERLNGIALTAEVKVDHEGHMYGSVSLVDILELLKLQTGIDLEKRSILLKHSIKEMGVYDISIKLKEGITATIHVNVVAEGTLAS